jgi:hypothetical protein
MKKARLLAGLLCAATLWASGAEKKMIGHSWDLLGVRPSDVARNLDAWENLPLDGISLALALEPEKGRKIGYSTIMNDPPWERAWFTNEAAVLRQCASRSLKHNFLTSYWAPRKRLAWGDEAAWAAFAKNIGTLAWLAKEGQARGILIDPEDYPETRQFFLTPGDAPFAETAALARKRGAQMMRSMAAEFPEIVLLSFWMLSLHPAYYMGYEDAAAMVADAGDLWPAFLNGMLDAMPPAARMIDGNEHGYRYQAEKQDFYLSAWSVQNKALALVAPENRIKYRTQVLAGFGLYLDMYTNPPESPWYFGDANGSRLNHLALNFAQALDAADEYIWIYGEKMDWIAWEGTSRKPNPTWESKLPGFIETLKILGHPEQMQQVVERRRQAGTLTNLLANSACAPAQAEGKAGFCKGKLPPAWGCWQHEKKAQGVFGLDTGKGLGDSFSLCAEGVAEGCFISEAPVQARNSFAVEAFAQGAAPRIRVRWKKDGRWYAEGKDVMLRFKEAAEGGWRHAFGLVQVPAGADALVLLLSTQQRAGELTWFDNAGVYPLSVP